jgi:hypothetical protein
LGLVGSPAVSGSPWAPCAIGMLGSFPATPGMEPDRSVLAAAETSITSTNLVETTSTSSAYISIYVSRVDDVARVDEFVGPKA